MQYLGFWLIAAFIFNDLQLVFIKVVATIKIGIFIIFPLLFDGFGNVAQAPRVYHCENPEFTTELSVQRTYQKSSADFCSVQRFAHD